jgi:DNA-binding GntR family transcriptional regulator
MSTKPTKKELVYRRIRRAIISGEFKPGEIMNEAEIAARFESGKTPTREALLLLAHEDFIETLPRVGYMVTQPTMQDILETFHLRLILEVEAIGLAAESMTPESVLLLEKNNLEEEMLSVAPTQARGKQGAALNRDFHVTIARIAGNARLTRIIQNLIDDMERMLITDPYLIDPSQHKKILTALGARDRILAQEAMRQHIEETRARILNRY